MIKRGFPKRKKDLGVVAARKWAWKKNMADWIFPVCSGRYECMKLERQTRPDKGKAMHSSGDQGSRSLDTPTQPWPWDGGGG